MNDELEFIISQYADGTLGDAESRALEARLAEDAEARAELERHRRIIAALRGLPAPQVSWDRLAAQVGSAIDKATNPGDTQPAAYRLHIGRVAWTAMGVAASVLIAAGIAVRMLGAGHGTAPIGVHAPVAIRHFANVIGPRAQVAQGPAMTDVSIGPGKGVTASLTGDRISRPASVLVASGAVVTDDTTPQMPF